MWSGCVSGIVWNHHDGPVDKFSVIFHLML